MAETVNRDPRRLQRRRAAHRAQPSRVDERLERAVRRSTSGPPSSEAAEDDSVRAGADHRRRPRLLLGRRPQGGSSRRPRAIPTSAPRCASATTRSSRASASCRSPWSPPSTARRRHRLLAGARLRPDLGARVGLLRARVRQHRAGAGRRLDLPRARARRARRAARDGPARRAGPGAAGARLGSDQPRRAGRRARRRGDALAERLAAGPTRSYASAKRRSTPGSMRHMDEQLDLEADIQREMAAAPTSSRASRRSSGSAPPDFKR